MYTNPDTFGKFLTLVDEDLHNAVVHEVEETRLADQQRNAVKWQQLSLKLQKANLYRKI